MGTATSFGLATFVILDRFLRKRLFFAGVKAFVIAAGSAGVIRRLGIAAGFAAVLWLGIAAGFAAVLRIGCSCLSGSMGSEFQTVGVLVLHHSRN